MTRQHDDKESSFLSEAEQARATFFQMVADQDIPGVRGMNTGEFMAHIEQVGEQNGWPQLSFSDRAYMKFRKRLPAWMVARALAQGIRREGNRLSLPATEATLLLEVGREHLDAWMKRGGFKDEQALVQWIVQGVDEALSVGEES